MAFAASGFLVAVNAASQEIEPRAYSPAPVGTTFVIAGAGRSRGPILVDPSLDIDSFDGDVWLITAGVGHVFGVAGRQARVLAIFPSAFGSVSAGVQHQMFSQRVGGLLDPRFKVTINLAGAPGTKSLAPAKRRPLMVGTSLTVSPPWGQYDSTQIVNLGRHRWAFKPEIGMSDVIARWTFEGYAGVWLFTANDQYYPGHAHREQDPIVTGQAHVSYALAGRSWVALGGTFFSGGQTRVDGVADPNSERNSRIGATLSLPIAAKQSVQFAYTTGVTTFRGWDFSSFNVTWQLIHF